VKPAISPVEAAVAYRSQIRRSLKTPFREQSLRSNIHPEWPVRSLEMLSRERRDAHIVWTKKNPSGNRSLAVHSYRVASQGQSDGRSMQVYREWLKDMPV